MSRRGRPKLKLLPYRRYAGVDSDDPLRFYFWPVVGRLYRRRVELCLDQCTGGKAVLEVGFGSGVCFLNLAEMYEQIYGLDLSVSVEQVRAVFAERGLALDLRNGNILSMPYEDEMFDTVLLISILEHLRPCELGRAFREVRRVLRPGGQVVYGVPVERRFMVWMFRVLGFDIRQHHFSTEQDVRRAAGELLQQVRVIQMNGVPRFLGPVYEIGHFVKPADPAGR